MEVAHDNATVKNYITEDLHLLNSYDMWHVFPNTCDSYQYALLGTKNVAKNMRKIDLVRYCRIGMLCEVKFMRFPS